MSVDKPIFVTQPHLPDLADFEPYLEKIWSNKILTNGGEFHVALEKALCEFLGVEYISLVANGTLGLITALQAARIVGEVITTPYSFVATAHSLLWNGNKPVFVDIDSQTLNIDPLKIEAAITPQTTAIMAVHCYGNPCDYAAIQAIAENYNLKVIFDSAHAFGVEDGAGSVLRHGDFSVLSFHATKVFNTFEGGAIISPDAKTKQHIDRLKNFGFVDETTVIAPGINAKMSEINAAFGLLQLKSIREVFEKRARIDRIYRVALEGVEGIRCLPRTASVDNYSYFPILVEAGFGLSRDALYEKFKQHNIFARRYFYPLITNFPMYKSLLSADSNNLPVANYVAERVLCLPIYPELSRKEQDKVLSIILRR